MPLATTRRASGDERGITLILFTLMITVMLVFVALALDSGLVFNERRQDQSAADSAVLAATQILLEGRSRDEAETAIIDGTFENTKSTNGLTLADWRTRWATCTATMPPGFVPGTKSQCLGFHTSSGPPDTTKVWAHLPAIRVESTFGGVVGIKGYRSTAEATGEIFLGTPYAAFAVATNCDFVPPVQQVVDIGTQDSSLPIVITGPMHSNGALQVQWQNATVNGFVTYVTPPAPPDPPVSSRQTAVETDPLSDISIAEYAPGGIKAIAAGLSNQYRNAGAGGVNDAWLDDANNNVLDAAGHLKNILIYTTGPIDIKVPRQGRATFVSTETITFLGDGFDLSARAGDVLAFSTAGNRECGGDPGAAIRFEGGNNTWNGVVYAPEGSIRSGINQETDPPGVKTFNGGLIGWIVDLDGSNFRITNDPNLGAPARVRLFQ